jgi:hypothetical protein
MHVISCEQSSNHANEINHYKHNYANMETVSFYKRFRKSIIALLVFVLLFLAAGFYLGFRHIPMHIADLWNSITSSSSHSNEAAHADTLQNTQPDSVSATPAITAPLDTTVWINAIKRGDYIPPTVMEELAMARKMDFSKLVVAINKPFDEQAEQALMERYGKEVINLLKGKNAHVKVGQCYEGVLQQNETARVSCMVSCFNENGDNLGNIQLPLITAYDFVTYQDNPNVWYVTDMSQNIPFDYQLNK